MENKITNKITLVMELRFRNNDLEEHVLELPSFDLSRLLDMLTRERIISTEDAKTAMYWRNIEDESTLFI